MLATPVAFILFHVNLLPAHYPYPNPHLLSLTLIPFQRFLLSYPDMRPFSSNVLNYPPPPMKHCSPHPSSPQYTCLSLPLFSKFKTRKVDGHYGFLQHDLPQSESLFFTGVSRQEEGRELVLLC